MNGFFYHGIEFYYGCVGESIELMVKILDEGLLVRNIVRNYQDEKYNHVCLYKKNDEFDYNDISCIHKSARAGWINNCFVFIINPEIEARKAIVGVETDLVDEWRSLGNILPSDFVGIALPHKSIIDYINSESYDEEEEQDKLIAKKNYYILLEKALEKGIYILDSEKENFTDEFDSTLKNYKKK